jgi:pimeloyl-ACP methyl ester carboxylesterase
MERASSRPFAYRRAVTTDRRRWFSLRRAACCAGIVFALWWAAGLLGAHLATDARPFAIPERTELGGRPVAAVATRTSDGVDVRGWLVRASEVSTDVAVLAAGIHGNRLAMLGRGEWYLAHGWSALLVDLRGTGASEPTRIAMGWHEALDLQAWHAFAAANGFRRIAVHGQSLGAAAAVYTAVRCAPPPAWHFVVLESCYRDIDAALAARLPWLPRPLTWPLVACSEWLLGVDAHDLAPSRAIAQLRAPTLCACGTLDNKVGADATTALLAASAAAVKERVDVPDIGHGDLWHAGDGVLPRRLAAFVAAR